MMLPMNMRPTNSDLQLSSLIADTFRAPIQWRKMRQPQAEIPDAAQALAKNIADKFDTHFPANAASNGRRLKALAVLAQIDPQNVPSDTVQTAINAIKMVPATTAFALKTSTNGRWFVPDEQRASWPRLSEVASALKDYAPIAAKYDIPAYPPAEHLGLRDAFSGQLQKMGAPDKSKRVKAGPKDELSLKANKKKIDAILDEIVPAGKAYDRVRQQVVDTLMARVKDVAEWKTIEAKNNMKRSTLGPQEQETELLANSAHYAMLNTFAGINERKRMALDLPIGLAFSMSEEQARDLAGMIRTYHDLRPIGERGREGEPSAKRARIATQEHQPHPELANAVSKAPAHFSANKDQIAMARTIHGLTKDLDANANPSFRTKLGLLAYVFEKRVEIGKLVPRQTDSQAGTIAYPLYDSMRSGQNVRFGKTAVALETLRASIAGEKARQVKDGIDWEQEKNPTADPRHKAAKPPVVAKLAAGQRPISDFFGVAKSMPTLAVEPVARGLKDRPRDADRRSL